MTAKYFCDVCGTPMENGEHGRLRRSVGPLKIEIMHCLNGTWNAGHVCHRCITHVVNAGETVDYEGGWLHETAAA